MEFNEINMDLVRFSIDVWLFHIFQSTQPQLSDVWEASSAFEIKKWHCKITKLPSCWSTLYSIFLPHGTYRTNQHDSLPMTNKNSNKNISPALEAQSNIIKTIWPSGIHVLLKSISNNRRHQANYFLQNRLSCLSISEVCDIIFCDF